MCIITDTFLEMLITKVMKSVSLINTFPFAFAGLFAGRVVHAWNVY